MTDAYADLDAFQALPRTAGLALSHDGTRLVTTSASLDPKSVKWVPALWEVDPTGAAPARRLTRSAKGESGPVFAADGTLLFTSARPDPEAPDDDEDGPAGLWALPPTGEARLVGSRPGGVEGVRVEGRTVLVLSDTLPGSTGGEDDDERRTARKDAKVSAVLHSGYPVRYWDHDLGVGQNRLLAGDLEETVTWRELTPTPGRGLHEASTALSPDGRTAVTTWTVTERGGASRTTLVAVDTTTGERRTLLDDAAADVGDPRVSPDGRYVTALRESISTPTEPVDQRLVVLALDGSDEPRDVAPGWDRWVAEHRWAPDGTALLVTADEQGRRPVFRVELASGAVTRLTGDAGHYTDLQVSPDGASVYALRDAVDAPPAPVRLDA
ncbi:MAG: peptidase, partial [Frankiales bacterium]|nr:peptidase [Frankiales bacterium]